MFYTPSSQNYMKIHQLEIEIRIHSKLVRCKVSLHTLQAEM